MATTATARASSVALEQQSVAAVEAQIRSAIRPPRSRYLREFQDAFRRYESVISPAELERAQNEASVILIGDYHSLEASQDFTAETVRSLAAARKTELVLCLEAFYSLDQPALDACSQEEISLELLRQRLQFEAEWGYDWAPYERLLQTAKECGVAVYGTDCRPRFDLRRVRLRDRHAASQISRIRKAHPRARIVMLVGESHLAPAHLPKRLRQSLPRERMLTVLQNIDALYWQAAAESTAASAVRVSEDVLCAFTSTPLEKYESYRRYLDRIASD